MYRKTTAEKWELLKNQLERPQLKFILVKSKHLKGQQRSVWLSKDVKSHILYTKNLTQGL